MTQYIVLFFQFCKFSVLCFGGRYMLIPLLTAEFVDREGVLTMDQFGNLLSVAQGSGVSIVSRLAAKSQARRGDILVHPLGADGSYRQIYIATSSTTPLTDTGRDMIKLVKKMYNC